MIKLLRRKCVSHNYNSLDKYILNTGRVTYNTREWELSGIIYWSINITVKENKRFYWLISIVIIDFSHLLHYKSIHGADYSRIARKISINKL